jgi:hypothetical protein
MTGKYYCRLCRVSFKDSKSFMLDRQIHISKGETKKQDDESKTIIRKTN